MKSQEIKALLLKAQELNLKAERSCGDVDGISCYASYDVRVVTIDGYTISYNDHEYMDVLDVYDADGNNVCQVLDTVDKEIIEIITSLDYEEVMSEWEKEMLRREEEEEAALRELMEYQKEVEAARLANQK